MQQVLDSGECVFFGQDLHEVEKLFSCSAMDLNLPKIARPGIDKVIKLKDVILRFDNGRLVDIGFELTYQFINPPIPYSEQWKNFDQIGTKKIFGGMSRDEFQQYLTVWEERAKTFGVEKTVSGDLAKNQFRVSLDDCSDFADHAYISMGPTRRTSRGGIWGDGWSLFFATDKISKGTGVKAGALYSLSAFNDKFNTVARHRIEMSPELPPRGTTLWTSREE